MKLVRMLALAITTVLLCSACSSQGESLWSKLGNAHDSNRNEVIEEILGGLERKDFEALRQLFSSNAIPHIENFNEDVNRLFEYFSGTVVSYKNPCGGAEVHIEKEDGFIKEEKYWTYDITTDECAYRIAFYEVSKDTKTPNNVGLWSIYIIKMEYDTDPEYAYRGDGEYTPGININVKNVLPEELP